jgi:hypothetical protein
MQSRMGSIACGLAVVVMTAACATQRPVGDRGAELYPAGPGAQTYVATPGDVTGTVVRVEPTSNVVVLDDGRMWQVAGDSAVFVDNQPAQFTTLRPGRKVALRSAKSVALRDGQYVVVEQPGAGTTTTVTTAPGTATTVTTSPYSGTVVRVDEQQRVLVFDDGKMWQTGGDSMVLVDGQPRVIGTIQPGSKVTVNNGYPVDYRDGRYVQLTPGTAAPAAGVRQTVWGQVTDVDRNGEIRIKTDKGSFEVRMPPSSLGSIKKGDAVQLDITIAPTSPAASPRQR